MAEMEQTNASQNLPPGTIILILVSAMLLAVVAIFILFPQNQKIADIKKEKRTAVITLERQKKLYPLFVQAKAMANMAFEPLIPLVKRTPLGRDKITTLSEIFTSIGMDNNMVLSSNTLDINSLKNRSDSVSMELVFTGDFFDYRNCLISLISLPFFNAVETIKITTDKARVKTFFTKIVINIDKK